ncbi:MAG: hypothetical protein ACYTHN_24535, partial [Planctomycetota bacterium]
MNHQKTCGACGNPAPAEDRFCAHCGAEIREPARPVQFAPPPSAGRPPRRSNNLPIFLVIGCIALLLLSCPVTCAVLWGIGSAVERREQREAAEKTAWAEAHWEQENHGEAVALYKDLLRMHFHRLDPDVESLYLTRVIHFDLEKGNRNSAKKFIRMGLERDISLDLKGEEAQMLLSVVQGEIDREDTAKEF